MTFKEKINNKKNNNNNNRNNFHINLGSRADKKTNKAGCLAICPFGHLPICPFAHHY